MAIGEESQHGRLRGLALADRCGTGPRDRRGQLASLEERRQCDEARAVGEVGGQARGRRHRETRLADATGSNQRDQAAAPIDDQASEFVDVGVAPEQCRWRGPLSETIVRRPLEGAQRREGVAQASRCDLIEPQRAEVLQSMLAQIAQRHSVDRLTGQQPLGRLADHHLASVRRRADARCAVHIDPDVVVAHHPRLTGVHSDPDPHRRPRWPLEPRQPSLRRNRRAHGIAGARERHEERVSLGAHLTAAVRGDRTPDDPPVLRQAGRHSVVRDARATESIPRYR